MHRLLLVEDDELVLRSLERVFTRAGYEVRAVWLDPAGPPVAELLPSLMPWPADAVLMDGLDGQAQALVQLCRLGCVPCAVYTGEPERYAQLQVPVLCKPADARDLLALVRQLVHGNPW